MIYNSDFVTNSSSTSFVLFTKDSEDFTLSSFLKALKVDNSSPLTIVYRELFNMIKENMSESSIIKIDDLKSGDFRFFDEFSADSIKEIKERIENGEKAFVGTISDDSPVGAYFMRKRIVIVGDTFYFNWEPDAY